ncbi:MULTISPECIES: type VII secretion target [Mycolicibacterium]|uniref:type VII secretion target n=1 Tax=Mycolicibacterium TaxID=1866885 RepID=UPI00096E674A|nr:MULTISPECIES: type VII secretion target [Mycolicibacterium]MCW1824193.1 type VII secretion target [Mycolicibacterium senegalense]QZH60225.1 ESX-1 secretion-associated protein [Mycolicibacterium farcinogenes]
MPSKSLKVDPIELRMAADHLDGHATEFSTEHQKAHSSASQATLGPGLAGAALPGMLAAWESDGTRFGENFVKHAEGHREAAKAYEGTDRGGAERISDAGSAL